MKNLHLGLLALLIIFIGFSGSKSYASHIPGANITYTCDPANPLTYTFTFTIFRKCPGTHPTTMSSGYFTLTNSCGLINPTVPTFNQVGVAQDVNQLCASAVSNCSGGTQPGVWKYTYESIITLPANCDSWNLAFELCCRDASSNLTGTTGNDIAVSTLINTTTAPCNSSPVVTAQPIPYACTNTNFNYCLTIADPEGDSTYFSLVAPAGNAQAPIASLAGFSATAPLNNFILDPLTGCISFSHPSIGNFVVAIQINSYNAAGNLIASIIHDFQVIVISCSNTPPTNPSGGISNISGTGSQTGPNTVAACFGDNICFDVVFQDIADPGNVITIQQDGTTLLPGATFTQTGTNPATGTFCWLSQPGFTGNVVTFIAEDDGCPVMGTSGFAVNFNITTGIFAGPDQLICGTQGTTLSGNGSGTYVWSPAAGLSCTNCQNPVATPASTTVYTVTGNLAGVCANTDQVTVNVVPDFTLVMNPANATVCANEIIQLNANGQAGFGPFTYNWSNSATLNNNSIVNPLATPLSSTIYTATVIAANGCTKDATSNVVVSGIGPTVIVTPSDTIICAGESVPLTTTSFVYPLVCGISSGCSGTTASVIVGNGTFGSSTYSPFYGSTSTTLDYTKKIQYIYTAAELNALGYFGGTIRRLDLFNTTTSTYRYDDVTIWMGCTSQSEYSNTTFIPTASLTQVFNANNINPTDNGWQNFNITDWDWDGISNIVVQFCAAEDGPSNVGTNSARYSSTSPSYRCVYDISSSLNSCNEATGSRTTSRADIRFRMCVEPASSPVYSWTTTTGLNNATISNPTATPGTTTSYVLDVTASGCTGSGIGTINIDNSSSVVASNDTTYCLGDPAVNLNAQFMINGVPTNAGLGSGCYDQTITYTNPALLNGTNNYNFAGTPPVATGGTLTITAYGDTDGAAEFWTIQDEGSTTLGTAGGSLTQCGTTHTVVIPLTAAQLNVWSANGSIDFAGVDVGGQVNATLCGVGNDLLGLRLQIDCPTGSGYDWTPITGLSDPNIQNPTVTPTGPITYVVKSTGGTCDAYDTVIVVMCSVLPVEMLSFDAICKEGGILINWATATEINNDYFTIEKSYDAINFEAIGSVNGNGNNSTTTNYSWTDNNVTEGKAYYRLKQTDFNGAHEYHGPKPVNCEKSRNISIYPNPFKNSFTVKLSEKSTYPLTIQVVDYLGRIVYSKTIETNLTVIEIDELTTGTYFVKAFNETIHAVERIVKMK